MARAPKASKRGDEVTDDGFWDRPVLMNLVGDVLIVFSIAALAWSAIAAFQRLPVFPLRELVVTGRLEQVTHAQLEQATRVAVAGNFFTVQLDEVRATFEKLPWVRRAEVRRRWPEGLELSIEEHVAVARWKQADGESRLVNDRGEVFAAATQASLPSFSGPEGSASQVLERYRLFEKALADTGRWPEVVTLSSREAWQIRLDGGLLIELGRDEAKHSISERLARFVTWYRPALDTMKVAGAAVADMRYPNGFTLRLQSKS
jgi:cell division protein FtsQ